MQDIYTDLLWLPAPPEDAGRQIRSLDPDAADFGLRARELARHRLPENQLTRLGKTVARAIDAGVPLAPLERFRLAVLGNGTLDLVAPVLVASAARHGIALDVVTPSFAQIAQEVLAPDSSIYTTAPDAVLFAIDHRALPVRATPGDDAQAARSVGAALDYLDALRGGVKRNSRALCIFQTFAAPPEALFGHLDVAVPGTLAAVLASVNAGLAARCRAEGDVLLDVASLAQTVGTARWHDPPMWNLAKLPFAHEMAPLYGEHIGRLVGAIRGKSRKALILDLDNTLWGGVIGDDGLDGIKIAQGDATGEAHLAVQRLALDLRARGIVLAVCSKNTDAVARTPFQDHPEMLLRLGDIAVFQANWDDKATNIRSIANELSLGIDAMVFLDDNPVERGLVRRLLPDVAVPELPDDPALYARTLAAAGYFEAISLQAEDLKRADHYQDNAKRAALLQGVDGVDAYLASLNMTISFLPFDAVGRARIVQLINKSNQFNLTTRRYTEPEIEEVETDPSLFGMQVRLADVFGDNGMISVVICRPDADAWDIDTWLMSCRVLGRKVETMVLRELLRQARRRGIVALRGRYLPTAKNALVVDHYRKLGFTEVAGLPSGETHWSIDVGTAEVEAVPIEIVSGFD